MNSQTAALRPGGTGRVKHALERLSSSRKAYVVLAVTLMGVWLGVVVFTATRHEFFRDEVRAWSLARDAASPLDLFGLVRYEGHPVLWYLLLYIGKTIVDTPLVLPVTSIAVAFTAVALFLLRAPFPLWYKALFAFSALPLYEYSVVARNYGISMLLLFVAAALYHDRGRHWLALAVVLALLANTNAHSALLAGLIVVVWAWDEIRAHQVATGQAIGRRFYAVLAIVAAGIALCAAEVIPPRDTIVTGVYNTTTGGLTDSFTQSILKPGAGFDQLFPASIPAIAGSVVLYVSVFGLVRRPVLLVVALVALVAFGVLYRMVYAGSIRHDGLLVSFLITLYWIERDTTATAEAPKWRGRLASIGLYGALLALIAAGLYMDRMAWEDIKYPVSSSEAFGQFLADSPTYRDAILVPEPDYFAEALPYYVHNRIYFTRENRFGTTVSWTSAAAPRLTLGQLLATAHMLKGQYGKPVLIVLGIQQVEQMTSGGVSYSYNKVFTWSAAERADADASLTPVASFLDATGDENYLVYAVR